MYFLAITTAWDHYKSLHKEITRYTHRQCCHYSAVSTYIIYLINYLSFPEIHWLSEIVMYIPHLCNYYCYHAVVFISD